MKFRIIYTRKAVKDISGLDRETKELIRESMETYSESPFKYARKLVESSLGTYRFRIRDYRVVFDIEDSQIIVLRVGHRRDIYRRK